MAFPGCCECNPCESLRAADKHSSLRQASGRASRARKEKRLARPTGIEKSWPWSHLQFFGAVGRRGTARGAEGEGHAVDLPVRSQALPQPDDGKDPLQLRSHHTVRVDRSLGPTTRALHDSGLRRPLVYTEFAASGARHVPNRAIASDGKGMRHHSGIAVCHRDPLADEESRAQGRRPLSCTSRSCRHPLAQSVAAHSRACGSK